MRSLYNGEPRRTCNPTRIPRCYTSLGPNTDQTPRRAQWICCCRIANSKRLVVPGTIGLAMPLRPYAFDGSGGLRSQQCAHDIVLQKSRRSDKDEIIQTVILYSILFIRVQELICMFSHQTTSTTYYCALLIITYSSSSYTNLSSHSSGTFWNAVTFPELLLPFPLDFSIVRCVIQ